MRYFERKRVEVYPENGRCGVQVKYHTRLNGVDRYWCYDHYKEPQRRVLRGEFATEMADGETMGCDYEP